MTNSTSAKANAIVQYAMAFIDAVHEADNGFGVPAGTLYAVAMGHGIGLGTFESIMALCVKTGKIRKEGHTYHPVK